MSSAPATLFVCLKCRTTFFAEYGCGGMFCSEACERPAMPDDDDGYDGLDYAAGDSHCVLAHSGCDPDALPEVWRVKGAAVIRELAVGRQGRFPPRWCVCDSDHTVLARADVRRLRAAGYVVEVNSDNCGDDEYRAHIYDCQSSGHDDECRQYAYQDRSPFAYLQGEFDVGDDLFDQSLCTMEHEWLTAILREEGEVLDRLGFSLPSGVREFYLTEPPTEELPTEPREDVATRVGPFSVDVRGGAYVVEHAYGGLVPRPDGDFASGVSFGSRGEAEAHAAACWIALRRGNPNPFRCPVGMSPGGQNH